MAWQAPERRAAAVEIRAKGRRLHGYAALFGVEAWIGDVRETIAPGAFTRSLVAGHDILALVDHDVSRVLARTRTGSLRLSQDQQGLAFDLDVPDTAAGRDVLTLAERGDLGGMSFGFTVGADGERRDRDRRELQAVILHEISVVQAWPAYDGTSVAARALDARTIRLDHARRYLELASL